MVSVHMDLVYLTTQRILVSSMVAEEVSKMKTLPTAYHTLSNDMLRHKNRYDQPILPEPR